MPRLLQVRFVLTLFLVIAARALAAPALDTVVFGDAASEAAHALVSNRTETIAGQLGQSARRCLPLSTVGVNGGDLTFTMAVDPVRRNYFTLKLWGGDDTDYQMGRLNLYVPIDGINHQVGYRHEGDYMPLSVTYDHPPLPGRFFYSTTLLPLWMTKGKTSLTLKIVSSGRIYPLGQGGPPSGNYQFVMDRASRGIYRAYTHLEPYAHWAADEPQGAPPAVTTRPSPDEEVMAPGGAFFNGVNSRINNRLTTATSTANFSAGDVAYLARSYSVSGLAGYQNPAVVNKVVALLDAFATEHYANPTTSVFAGGNEGWGGRFGNLGQAIHYLQAALTPPVLDASVNYGSTTTTRRRAWADMLYSSREYGRLRDRRTLTNQTMIANQNIYLANKGLLFLGDARAFPETDAQRYIKEAAGLLPWLGNDLSGGGSANLYGTNYHQVTAKGLTREWGYVGAGYGEMAHKVATWYRLTGNTAFRDQAVKMAVARAPFRRPAIEVSGSAHYRTMEVIGLLAWRGAHESDGNYAGYVGYADAGNTGVGAIGMMVAAATGDPTITGYAKQMLADRQFFTYATRSSNNYRNIEALEAFADYQTVKAAADGGARLPMTDGQPDFAWADEENAILALKQGNNRLWITAYWQAKAGTAVNAAARFHYSTPTWDQYGTMETTPRVRAAGTFTRGNLIDKPEATIYTPPDNPSNAYAGEVLPVGPTPPGASSDDPFRGRADFYSFRFGPYLVGLNAQSTHAYTLNTPVGFTSATDLITGATKSGPITVAPLSTVVLDLGTPTDPSPVPATPLVLTAAGSSQPSITLNWTDASGATAYTLRRSATPGGPYAEILDADGNHVGVGLTGTTFTDTYLAAGSTYYYVVAASNANGSSADSMEASASAGIPGPWVDVDVGSVSLAGNTSYTDRSFSVSGAGSTIGSTADSFHFAYIPVAGDGAMVARLSSRVLSGSGADKIGLMIRDGTGAGAPYFSLMVDKGFSDQARVSYRSANNGGARYDVDGSGAALAKHYVTIPCWLKLERAGNLFTASTSADGSIWTVVGTATLTLSSIVNFGLFACSRNTAARAQGVFDGVSVQPGYWGATPPTPTSLSVINGSGSVDLTWAAAIGATGYKVKRATVSGGPYITVATTTSTAYSDSGLTNGVTYFYVVSAGNPAGDSADSAEAAGTAMSARQAWRFANFGTVTNAGDAADHADPDGDNLPNLLEYAIGSDPLLADTSPLSTGLTNDSPPRFQIVFDRSPDSSLIYSVEASSDLQTWTTIAVNPGQPGTSVTVTDSPSGPRRFLRLRVSPAP